MTDVYECIHRYRKLLQLIDEDMREIKRAIQGELLYGYLDIAEREKEILEEAIKSIENIR